MKHCSVEASILIVSCDRRITHPVPNTNLFAPADTSLVSFSLTVTKRPHVNTVLINGVSEIQLQNANNVIGTTSRENLPPANRSSRFSNTMPSIENGP